MQATKDLLSSKKAIVLILGVVAIFAGYALNMPADKMETIIYLIMTYLGAQGMADFGKGKAQVVSATSEPAPNGSEERI